MLPAETPSVQSGVFREDRPTVRYPSHIPAAILHLSQIVFRVAATPRTSHIIPSLEKKIGKDKDKAVDASGRDAKRAVGRLS